MSCRICSSHSNKPKKCKLHFLGIYKPNVANLFLGLTGKMQAYIFKFHFAYPPRENVTDIFFGPPLLICRDLLCISM